MDCLTSTPIEFQFLRAEYLIIQQFYIVVRALRLSGMLLIPYYYYYYIIISGSGGGGG